MTAMTQPETIRKIDIDFMFVDLDACTRCKGTNVNLETALKTVGTVAESAGAQVTVRKILVDTEDKARELSFVSSPTIRINGRDIALELRESSCASCGEACGCEGGIDCRVWIHEGEEHTVAPVPMIVNAILAAVYGTKEVVPIRQTEVPENLKRFFAAKAAKTQSSCCGAEEQAVCCEPDQKLVCCAPVEQTMQQAGCGCR